MNSLKTIDDERLEHPAAVAWMQLQSQNHYPTRIDVISQNEKSSVFRLYSVGSFGSSLIAKRCGLVSVGIERMVYEEILPRLPVPTLRFYGVITESQGEHGWIFLEDAGDQTMPMGGNEAQELISRCVAAIHVAAESVGSVQGLPDSGPNYFLHRLGAIKLALQDRLVCLHAEPEDEQVLQSFMDVCDQLELSWHKIEDFCFGLPKTLVHGDLAPENFRIRKGKSEPELLILDWEKTGWGVPAVDLTVVDPGVYYSVVSSHWPALGLANVEQLQRYGRIFRTLVHDIAGKPMRKIERYVRRLANELWSAGLA